MKKRLLSFLFLASLLAAEKSVAGNDNVPMGARASGMANATATLSDVWALSNNVAGLANLEKAQLGTYFSNRFQIKAFNSTALLGALPTERFGTYGVEAYRFGDDLYSETRVGVGVAKKMGFVSLGVKVNGLQTRIQELGSHMALVLEFGGQVELGKQLVLGAHIYNLNQARISDYRDERIPTVMKAGLSYRPFEKLMLNVETEKSIDYDAEFKGGAEYLLAERVALRTGFSTLSRTAHFGAGVKFKSFQFDYALSSSSQLGFSNHLSLSYQFQ